MFVLLNSTIVNAASTEITGKADQFKIKPELTVADNSLKPKITFYNKKTFASTDLSLIFEFAANSGINVSDYEDPLESSEEIISEYIADGGNIEFETTISYKFDELYLGLGGYYSLLTTDAISTDNGSSNIINVDAEIYGLKTMLVYKFNSVSFFTSYRSFSTSGEGQNADFTSILDDGKALAFGVDIPLSDGGDSSKDYILKFERTKHSNVDKAIFRVSIAKPFNF